MRSPPRPTGSETARLSVALAVCAALGAASLAVRSGLGYDPWAWLVWGRELTHLHLHTAGGPSWKPLPAILIAPFTPLHGAAPWIWLAFARAAAFAALYFAYRLGARLGGRPPYGMLSAAALAFAADFFVTALRGYSEPLLIALVLAAVDRHLAGRRVAVLWLATVAGLLRPEVWLFTGLYGLWLMAREPAFATFGARVRIVVLVAVAPVVWLATDLAGSGNALEASHIATTSPQGSAAKSSTPALTVIGHMGDAVIVPVLVLAVVAAALAVRRLARGRTEADDGAVAVLAGLTLGWLAVVAVMAEFGFTGRRRYLAVAAALACVLAAPGLRDLLAALHPATARRIALASALVLLAAFAFSPARTDYRLIALARTQKAQNDELGDAVRVAGGQAAVGRLGGAVVNPYLQTALAWKLNARLAVVGATWSSSRGDPHWSAPAVLFRGPAKLTGPRPAIPRGTPIRVLGHAGRWQVVAAG